MSKRRLFQVMRAFKSQSPWLIDSVSGDLPVGRLSVTRGQGVNSSRLTTPIHINFLNEWIRLPLNLSWYNVRVGRTIT